MRTRSSLVVALLGAASLVAVTAAARSVVIARPERPAPAAKRPVVDTLHGVKITDDYRWLEKNDDPEVKKWVAAESAYTQKLLDEHSPVEAIYTRLMAIDEARPVAHRPFVVGGRWYAERFTPGLSAPVLLSLPGGPEELATAKVLVDPNTPDGLTSVDFMVPSFDGTKVAVSLSEKGTESGTVFIYDLATGQRTTDVVPRVNGGTAGGDVAWLPDSSGFYYTRYPRKGERPPAELDFWQQVWLHQLGTPTAKDTYVVGKEFPKIAEIALTTSPDGQVLLIEVKNGDGGEIGWWLRGADGRLSAVAGFKDGVLQGHLGHDGGLYLMSVAGAARGRILRVPVADPALATATVVVPEGAGRIESFTLTKSKLWVNALVGGPSELRVFGLDGKGPKGGKLLPTPKVSAVAGLVAVDATKHDEVLVATSSFVAPTTWQRFTPAGKKGKPSPLSLTSSVDFSPYTVERVFATSKDGTQVPISLVYKKGLKKNGTNLTLLTGYGGYGLSMTPRFSPALAVWLEQGGVWALANLRGGGEFGETWHTDGMLTKKQNVFDDFIACAEHLVKLKLTAPRYLAIQGGSNGGLLMGAVMTQRPELFGAVISTVGIYDSLRVELSPNGEFNVTEFGTVKDKAQFEALYAYSPYHRVVDGTRYPPLLLMTGDNDPRVAPMQSRKFAARLVAAGAESTLLYTNPDAGHGTPKREQRVREAAYRWAFIYMAMGETYAAEKVPKPKPVKGQKGVKAGEKTPGPMAPKLPAPTE